MKKLILATAALALAGTSTLDAGDAVKNPTVVIKTSMGTIKAELAKPKP